MNLTINKSLIWKDTEKQNHQVIDAKERKNIINDFNIRDLVKIISHDNICALSSERFLDYLTNKPQDIFTRHALLSALLDNNEALDSLKDILMLIEKLDNLHKDRFDNTKIKFIVKRVAKLEIYSDVIHKLKILFTKTSKDEHHQILKEYGLYFTEKIEFDNLEELINVINRANKIISSIKSVDIGVNYDPSFKIRSTTITAINNFAYKKEFFIDKISKKQPKYDKTPLAGNSNIKKQQYTERIAIDLYQDLEILLRKEISQIEEMITPFNSLKVSSVLAYKDELLLYLAGISLQRFYNNNNIDYCLPTCSTKQTTISNFHSIHMNIEKRIREDIKVVKNSITKSKDDKVLIITGPNNSGKSVMLQSIAVIQLLFQAGLPVPCQMATLKVYNNIFSHFPQKEEISSGTGRLGEELIRAKNIMDQMDANTLVFLNEPFATTSPEEGLEILRLSLQKFISHHVDLFLVTHYLDIIDSLSDTSGITSFVMGCENYINTYKISRGIPSARSYAEIIAKKYEIDINSIIENLHQREIIDKKQYNELNKKLKQLNHGEVL